MTGLQLALFTCLLYVFITWTVPTSLTILFIAYLHRNYDNYVRYILWQNRILQSKIIYNIIELAPFEVCNSRVVLTSHNLAFVLFYKVHTSVKKIKIKNCRQLGEMGAFPLCQLALLLFVDITETMTGSYFSRAKLR